MPRCHSWATQLRIRTSEQDKNTISQHWATSTSERIRVCEIFLELFISYFEISTFRQFSFIELVPVGSRSVINKSPGSGSGKLRYYLSKIGRNFRNMYNVHVKQCKLNDLLRNFWQHIFSMTTKRAGQRLRIRIRPEQLLTGLLDPDP